MRKYNFFERIMLMNSYIPTAILIWFGFILCQFFLSEHQLWLALAVFFIFILVGITISWKKDLHQLAEKAIGKAMLTQAKPANIICCTIGLLVLSYGVWLDSYLIMIGGGIIAIVSSQLAIKRA